MRACCWRMSGSAKVRRGGALAAVVLLSAPVAADAAGERPAGQGPITVALGVTYGGVTSQNFPVVIEVSNDRRRIVRAAIAARLRCSTGGSFAMPDGYSGMRIGRRGRFAASFGPQTSRQDDGTTLDFEGSVRGRFNANGTRAAGTWKLKATARDAAGAVTETCDAGTIRWRAKQ